MTETERLLQEITECTNEIESLISQKSVLDIQSSEKQAELKAINDEIAKIQGALIQKEKIKSDLEIVEKWLLEKEGKQ